MNTSVLIISVTLIISATIVMVSTIHSKSRSSEREHILNLSQQETARLETLINGLKTTQASRSASMVTTQVPKE